MLKLQKHTLLATAKSKFVLEKFVDHTPHPVHTLFFGEKLVSIVFLATFSWLKTIPEVDATNVVFGLKEVLASNISKIKKLNFPQYIAEKPKDIFCALF